MQTKLFITILLAFCELSSTASAEEQIVKIGHVGPLSGQIAHLGKDNENGARMAIDVLNTKGITIAGKKIKFVLVPALSVGAISMNPTLV